MISKFIIQRFFLFVFINLSKFSKSKIQIILTFNGLNDNFLYCDDEINYYGTSNLNFYEINESNEIININSKLKLFNQVDDYFLKYPKSVFYKPNSSKEKILIEMINNPPSIKKFFAHSTASSIEIKEGFLKNYVDCSSMFYNCNKLTSIDLSNFSFGKIEDMNFLFRNCYNLENVVLNYAMFYRCGKLTSIDLSNFSFEKTKDLLSLFVGCRNLEKIV